MLPLIVLLFLLVLQYLPFAAAGCVIVSGVRARSDSLLQDTPTTHISARINCSYHPINAGVIQRLAWTSLALATKSKIHCVEFKAVTIPRKNPQSASLLVMLT